MYFNGQTRLISNDINAIFRTENDNNFPYVGRSEKLFLNTRNNYSGNVLFSAIIIKKKFSVFFFFYLQRTTHNNVSHIMTHTIHMYIRSSTDARNKVS